MAHVSKSEVREAHTLKAGHPPAVKAGGMRVVKRSAEEPAAPEKEARRPDKPRSVVASRVQHISLVLAGTLEKFSHDFPETPVSVRHSRVKPAMEKPHAPRTFIIQQPRKF
ncbi:death-associated protein-like 1 homolog [Denticeps clupeoides]|uniref:Death-associated protein 1 n=1 Tax=Denticeps clupeoides TaxID=299321 RepID=A0AAY4CM66_9TELE|nr:death-associated protein-like 1 [Denticeps clupeoides]